MDMTRMNEMDIERSILAAARAIESADALIIMAGAGIGVDSGLPNYRGDEGLWRAYPPLKELGMSFESAANPEWFQKDPTMAWGFYGHRQELYRNTKPHHGFTLLKRGIDKLTCRLGPTPPNTPLMARLVDRGAHSDYCLG
jgi:NAD-dependent SIR2 family protein deacetylase